MKIESIDSLWEVDSKIDSIDLNGESLKIPQLHQKYFKILNEEILSLKYFESQQSIIRKKKWAYYTGISIDENNNEVFPVAKGKKFVKDDINAFIEGDQEFQDLKLKIEYQEQKIKYLESTIKEISQRTWNIKNAIEWHKFTNPEH